MPRSSKPTGCKTCRLCGRASRLVSTALEICGECIRSRPEAALPIAKSVHAQTRSAFNLPVSPPDAPNGVKCPLCSRECVIGAGGRGFCGLRTADGDRLVHLGGTPRHGILDWYRDPLPTNCVADWVCDGSRQFGFHNLAVFYSSCTFNCLFCQNWHFRRTSPGRTPGPSAEELAGAANPWTFCACFFGGDPASQMLHALTAARHLANSGVVVCWETAGTSQPKLLDYAVQLSLDTGGCVKFDLKALDNNLHTALTGASNQRTLENFARAARRSAERPTPPLVVASSLLVPGYVDAGEVERIARFIAGINPNIPYSLLAFAPQFYMADLPRTSRAHAEEAQAAARAAGLTNVRIGNRHLLSAEPSDRQEV